MAEQSQDRYNRNWRRFQELMRLANEGGRRQCLLRNSHASEEEIRRFLRDWWARLKADEKLPPGWTQVDEWRH